VPRFWGRAVLALSCSSFVLAACAEGSKEPLPTGGVLLGGSSGASGNGGGGEGGTASAGANAGTAGVGGTQAGEAGSAGANAGSAGSAGESSAGAGGGAAGETSAGAGGGGAAGETSAGAGGGGAAGETTAGGNGGAGSGGAGSGGADAGEAGAGGADAGAGGVGAAGGSGGGSAGAAGAAAGGAGAGAAGGAGVAGSGAGQGGAGTAGAAGSAGGGTTIGPALVAVAVSASGQLVPARYESLTWTAGTSSVVGSGRPAMVAVGASAVAAFPVTGGALRFAKIEKSLDLVAGDLAPVVKNGPSLSATATGARVVYTIGNDTLFTSVFAGGSFGAASPLTSDASPPLSAASPTAARSSIDTSEASVHAGTNEGVYFAPVGGASTAVVGAGSKTFASPSLVFDAAGQPVVFFVRNTDSQVCVTVRKSGNWTNPIPVAANAFTDRSPSATRTSGGELVVVWHGLGKEGIYLAHSSAGDSGWGTGATVAEAAAIASTPTVFAGPSGAAEILFVRGGVAHHARLQANVVTEGAAFGSGLTEIAGAYVAE
jgi:hypothetical protein